MASNQEEAPFTPEDLRAALAEELAKVQDSGGGWVISNVTLDGVPVELPRKENDHDS